MGTVTATTSDPFIHISNVLAHKKTKSKGVKELYKSIRAADKDLAAHPDINTLASRITILEKIGSNKVLPERTYCFHMVTLGVSYIGIKAYDKVRAHKILEKKQNLIDQYLTQLFASIDTDPSQMTFLIEILPYCSLLSLRKILIYARQKKYYQLAMQCSQSINCNHMNSTSQNSENQALISALKEKNTGVVLDLLARGASVNFHVESDVLGERKFLPLLMWIFYQGAEQYAKILIEAGVDIDLRGRYGRTALMLAASNNQLDLVNFLIKAHARLNLQDTSGYTALIHAVLRSDAYVSLTLIHAGAKLDLQISHNPYKPEWLPIERARAEKAQDTLPGVGDTALTLAASKGDETTLCALIRAGANLNLQTETKHTALTRAIANLRSNSALLLIQAGAELNLQTTSGYTALTLAICKGLPTVASYLIKKKAALNTQNIHIQDGYTPLMLAIEYDQIDIALELIEAGAELNLQTTSGYTALTLAICKGLSRVASLLIKKNAALNIQNIHIQNGYTPLMLAIQNDQIDIALELIEAGANWDLHTHPQPGKPTKTALSLAEERHQTSVIKALMVKRTAPYSVLKWMRWSNTQPSQYK